MLVNTSPDQTYLRADISSTVIEVQYKGPHLHDVQKKQQARKPDAGLLSPPGE